MINHYLRNKYFSRVLHGIINIDDKKYPEKIYKYRTFSTPHHLNVVEHNDFYFAAPNTFDDNEDLVVKPNISPERRKELAFSKLKHENASQYELEQSQTNPYFLDFISHYYHSKEFTDPIRNMHKVFCTSLCYDSNYQWERYGNSHTGFCAEINLPRFLYLIGDYYKNRSIYLLCRRVIYDDQKPDFIFENNPNSFINDAKCFFYKTSEWILENEYRLILRLVGSNNENGENVRLIPINNNLISSVYLGYRCNLEDTNVKRIIQVCRTRNITIYKMKKNPDTYSLQREKYKG